MENLKKKRILKRTPCGKEASVRVSPGKACISRARIAPFGSCRSCAGRPVRTHVSRMWGPARHAGGLQAQAGLACALSAGHALSLWGLSMCILAYYMHAGHGLGVLCVAVRMLCTYVYSVRLCAWVRVCGAYKLVHRLGMLCHASCVPACAGEFACTGDVRYTC